MPNKNLFLFYGSDNYTASQKLQHWRMEFEKKYGEFNIHIFDGDNMTAADFTESLATLPFLSEKKLIIISDFLARGEEDDRKKVAEKLEETPDHCVVVFIEHKAPDARTALFKKLCKNGQAIEFKDMEKQELITWIKNEFKKNTIVIGNSEAILLADMVGPDLWQMSQEINKLALYGNSMPIDREAVEELASPNLMSSIFKLTDSIAEKNGKGSIKTLNTLILNGEQLLQIFFMIVRQFRILIQTRSCLAKKLDRNQIIQRTETSPYFINKVITQSKNFTDEKLAWIYKKLMQVDIDTKSGRIRTTKGDNTELRLALEKIIVELCNG
jgi:DNA polymerase III subunit delta